MWRSIQCWVQELSWLLIQKRPASIDLNKILVIVPVINMALHHLSPANQDSLASSVVPSIRSIQSSITAHPLPIVGLVLERAEDAGVRLRTIRKPIRSLATHPTVFRKGFLEYLFSCSVLEAGDLGSLEKGLDVPCFH